MDTLQVLLVLNTFDLVLAQTCSEFRVHEVAHQNKYLDKYQISCLPNLSLDACALECLLVKVCKSINYIEAKESAYKTMCELNSMNHSEALDAHLIDMMIKGRYFTYIDIRDWKQEVAGTCAARPCEKNNQRCLPTRPYRCIDIDCGRPPVYHISQGGPNMEPLPTNSSLGSMAYYKCLDSAKYVNWVGTNFGCLNRIYRFCNSDSSWSQSQLACFFKHLSHTHIFDRLQGK